jgi:hypothetical protein
MKKLISILILLSNYSYCQNNDSISIVFENCKIKKGEDGNVNLFGISYNSQSFLLTSKLYTQVKMYSLRNPKVKKRKHTYEVKKISVTPDLLKSLNTEIKIYWDTLVNQCEKNKIIDCNNFENIMVWKSYIIVSNSKTFPYVRPSGFSENIGSSVWFFDSKYMYIITVIDSQGGAGLLSLCENNIIKYSMNGEDLSWKLVKKLDIFRSISSNW